MFLKKATAYLGGFEQYIMQPVVSVGFPWKFPSKFHLEDAIFI